MGNLLGAPVTEKETHRGIIHETDDDIPYAVSSMQGWRVHMEDAHICQTELYAQELITNTTTATTHGHDETDMDCVTQNKKAKKDDASSSAPSPEDDANPPLDGADGADIESAVPLVPVTLAPASITVAPSSPVTECSASVSASSANTRQIHLPRHSLFACFDGHGGTYAAMYAGHNFCRVLSTQPAFVEYARYVQQTNQIDAAEPTPTDEDETTSSNKDESPSSSDTTPPTTLTPAQRAELDRLGLQSLEAALRSAFIEIDREIYQTQHPHHPSPHPHIPPIHPDAILPTNKEEEDSGSTAVVVILTPQWIVCANAGDSRAVYSKERHRAIPLSYDHKPNDEAEEQRIQDAGGFVRAGRVEGDLAVSRGLGDFRFKEAETVIMGVAGESYDCGGEGGQQGETVDNRARRMKRRDSNAMILPEDQKVSPVPDIIVQNRSREDDEFIILACDGIWDVVSNHDCVQMVAEIFKEGEADLGLLCEEILDSCLLRNSKDNMTALVLKMPAQTIGAEGAGVMERRRAREAFVADENC